MLANNKVIAKIKTKFTLNNFLLISFAIIVSIIIILSMTFGGKKLWYDVMSVTSVFYILVPILLIIFVGNENKGLIRKTIDLFKFKEMKEIKNNQLSLREKEKLEILKAQKEEKNNKKQKITKSDLLFVSTILIIYGIILLVICIPFLVMY